MGDDRRAVRGPGRVGTRSESAQVGAVDIDPPHAGRPEPGVAEHQAPAVGRPRHSRHPLLHVGDPTAVRPVGVRHVEGAVAMALMGRVCVERQPPPVGRPGRVGVVAAGHLRIRAFGGGVGEHRHHGAVRPHHPDVVRDIRTGGLEGDHPGAAGIGGARRPRRGQRRSDDRHAQDDRPRSHDAALRRECRAGCRTLIGPIGLVHRSPRPAVGSRRIASPRAAREMACV